MLMGGFWAAREGRELEAVAFFLFNIFGCFLFISSVFGSIPSGALVVIWKQ